MRIDNIVGTAKNNKLDNPKEDKSLRRFSFLPNVIPIERIKRKVHVRDMNSFPFLIRRDTRKRPARIPRHIMIMTSIIYTAPLLKNFLNTIISQYTNKVNPLLFGGFMIVSADILYGKQYR